MRGAASIDALAAPASGRIETPTPASTPRFRNSRRPMIDASRDRFIRAPREAAWRAGRGLRPILAPSHRRREMHRSSEIGFASIEKHGCARRHADRDEWVGYKIGPRVLLHNSGAVVLQDEQGHVDDHVGRVKNPDWQRKLAHREDSVHVHGEKNPENRSDEHVGQARKARAEEYEADAGIMREWLAEIGNRHQ